MSEGSVGRIDLDLEVNKTGFQSQLGGIANMASGLLSSAFAALGAVVASAFSIGRLIDFGKGCIELASNLNEVQNVVDVTFGSMNGEINNFAQTALQQFGLSELSAKKFASTIGAMLKSSGITGKNLLGMSEGITGLAADMASFYNLSQQEAFDKIRAGLAGEVEPLRQLGVNMSVANIQAYALSQGIKGNIANMSQAQQSVIRYGYLLKVTSDSQGDFARTSKSWANQMRLLSEQWNIFKGTMGAAFINILTPVISLVNTLITKLQTAAAWFKALTEAIFGNAAASSSAADAADDYGDATDAAGGKAKGAGGAAKGLTANFDKLNTLGSPGGGGSASAGGGLAGMPDIKLPEVKLPKIDTAGIREVVDLFKRWADSVKTDLQPSLDSLGSAVGRFLDVFKSNRDGTNWWLETFIPATAKFLGGTAFTYASDVFTNLRGVFEIFQGLFTLDPAKILNGVKDLTTGILAMPIDLLGAGVDYIGRLFGKDPQVLNGIQKVKKAILEFDMGKVVDWIKKAGEDIGKFFSDLWNSIGPFFSDLWEDVSGYFSGLWDSVTGVWDTAAKWFDDNVIQPMENFFRPIRDTISQIFTGLWIVIQAVWITVSKWFNDNVIQPVTGYFKKVKDDVSGHFRDLWAGIQNIWNGVSTWFQTKVVQPVVGWFGGARTTVRGHFNDLWNDVKGVWTTVSDWFKQHVIDPLVGFFKTAWDDVRNGFETALNGIKTIAKSIFNGIIGIIESGINKVISGINGLIEGFNKVVQWGAKVTGQNWGGIGAISPVTLPRLANGGIITQPTLAMMGEGGKREAVVPLENSDFIRSFAAEIASRIGGGADLVAAFRQALMESGIGSPAYILRVEGANAGFFRNLVLELRRAEAQGSVFATPITGGVG